MQRDKQIVRGQVTARVRWAALALVSASLAAGGCRAVLGIDDTDEVPDDCFPGTHAEGKGVGWWSTCNEEQACFSAGAPVASDQPDTPDEPDLETFYLANRTMHLGSRNQAGEQDANAWQDIGFDLDGVCTLSPPCESPGGTVVSCRTASTVATNDGKLCRDNQIGRLAYLFETREGLNDFIPDDPELNCSLCRGDYNFILRVQGYNGTANDPTLRVDFYPSTGIDRLKDLDCSREDWDPGDPGACWTREDRWNIQRESLAVEPSSDTDITESRAYDPTAFVRASTLFVHLPPNTIMWYPSGDSGHPMLPLTVQEGTLTGTLTRTDAGWVLEDGLITGRTKATDMLTGLAAIGVCPGTPEGDEAENLAREWVDVLSSGQTRPDVPCDSLSLAVTLTAAQADVGVIESFPLPNRCAAPPEELVEPAE